MIIFNIFAHINIKMDCNNFNNYNSGYNFDETDNDSFDVPVDIKKKDFSTSGIEKNIVLIILSVYNIIAFVHFDIYKIPTFSGDTIDNAPAGIVMNMLLFASLIYILLNDFKIFHWKLLILIGALLGFLLIYFEKFLFNKINYENLLLYKIIIGCMASSLLTLQIMNIRFDYIVNVIIAAMFFLFYISSTIMTKFS